MSQEPQQLLLAHTWADYNGLFMIKSISTNGDAVLGLSEGYSQHWVYGVPVSEGVLVSAGVGAWHGEVASVAAVGGNR